MAENVTGGHSMRAIVARAPLFRKGAVLVISTLILLVDAPVPRAETGQGDVEETAGPAADGARATSPAGGQAAAAKDEISRAIASYGRDIRDAYYRALIENPKIDGEIIVSFTVRPGGEVADVRIEKSSLNWPPLEEEVLSRIASWKFAPFEGEPIPATVPYKFDPN